MKKVFSKEYMRANCGCYGKVPLKMESIFFAGGNTEISIDDILRSGIPLIDKFWFIIRKTELTVDQKCHIAISVAEIVLPLYELRYPDDARVRDCVEATKLFLAGCISVNTLMDAKRAAADADAYAAANAADAYAYAAANAANAAHATAADAVYAADADAYADAYAAAYAAVYAANAAAADAYAAAGYTEKLFNFLTEFVKNN